MHIQDQKIMNTNKVEDTKRTKRRGIVLVAVLIIVAMLLPLITLVIASLNTEGANIQNQLVSSKVDQATQTALNEGIDLTQKTSQIPDYYTSNAQPSQAIKNLSKTGVPREKYGPSGYEGAGPDKVYGTDDDYWIGPRGDRSFKRGDDVKNPSNYSKDFTFLNKHGPVYLGQQWSYNSEHNPFATNNTDYGSGDVAAGPPTFPNQYFPFVTDASDYKGYDPRYTATFDRDSDGLLWLGRGYYPYADDESIFNYYRINGVSQINAPGSATDPANLSLNQFLSYFDTNRARLHEPLTRDFKKDAPGLEGLKAYLNITDEAGRLNLNIFAKKIKVWAPEDVNYDYDTDGYFTNDFNQDTLTKVPGSNMPQMIWKWVDNPMFPDSKTEYKMEMDLNTLGIAAASAIDPIDLDASSTTNGNGEDIQHWYYVDTTNRLGGNPDSAKDWAHYAFQSKRILMSLPGVDENLAENILLAMNPGSHTLKANYTVDGSSKPSADNPRTDVCNLTPWRGALRIDYDSQGRITSRQFDFNASLEDDLPLPMPRLFSETRELLDVKGMTVERYKRLQDLVTVHSYDTNYLGNYISDIPQSADPINPPSDEIPVAVPDNERDVDTLTDARYPIDKVLPDRSIDTYRTEAKRMLAYMYNHLDITNYKKLTLPAVDRGGRVPGDPDYNTNTPSVPNPGNPALSGLGQFVSLNPQLTLDSFLSYQIYRNGLPNNLDFYYGDPGTAPATGETPNQTTLPGIPWPGTRDSFLPFWNAQPFNAPDPSMGRNVDAVVKSHKIDSVADLLEVPLYRFDRMMVSALASPPSALVCDDDSNQNVVKITYLVSLSDILGADEPTVGGNNEYTYNPAMVIPGFSDGYIVNAPYNVYIDVDNDGNFDRVWDMNNDGVPDVNPQLTLSSASALPANSTDRRIPMQSISGDKNKALFIAGMGINANDNALGVFERLPNLVAYWKFCSSATPPDAFTSTAPAPDEAQAGSRDNSLSGFAYDAYGNPYITSRIVVIKNEGTTMETRSDRLVKIFVQNNCDGYIPLRTNVLATRTGTNTFTFQSSTAGGNNPTGLDPKVSDRKWFNWFYQKTNNVNDNPQPEDPNQIANPPYTTPIGQVNIMDQVDPMNAGLTEGYDPDRDPDGCWPPAFIMTMSPNYGQVDPRFLPMLTINAPVLNREDEVMLIVSNYNPNGVGYPASPPTGLEYAYDTVKLESLGALSPLVGQVTCLNPSINQGELPQFKVSAYGGVPPYRYGLQIRQDNGAHTNIGNEFVIGNSSNTEETIETNLNLSPGNYWAELTVTDSNQPATSVFPGAAWENGRPSPPDRSDPHKTFFMVATGGKSGGKSVEDVPSFNASFNVLPLSSPSKGFTVIPSTTGGIGNYVYRWDVTTTNGDRVYSADKSGGGTSWYYHGLPKVNSRAYISFNRSETFYFDTSKKSDGIYIVRLSIIDKTNEDPSLSPAGASSIATKVQKVVLYGENSSTFQDYPSAVLYANPPGNASSIGVNSTVPTQPPDPLLTPFLLAPADVNYPLSERMAPVGSSILIYGRNFDPISANNIVTFGGNVVAKNVARIASSKPAPLDFALRVTVPDGARSGYITVSRGSSQVSNQVFFLTNMSTAFDLVANLKTTGGGGMAPSEKWTAKKTGTGFSEFPAVSGVFQLRGGIPNNPSGLKVSLNGTLLTYVSGAPLLNEFNCSKTGLITIGGTPLKENDVVVIDTYALIGDGSATSNNRPYRLELDYQGDGVWDEKLEFSTLPGSGDGVRTSNGSGTLVHDYSAEGFGNYTSVLRVTDMKSGRIAVSKQLIQVSDPQNAINNPNVRPKAYGLSAQIRPTFGDQYPSAGKNLTFEALVGGLQNFGKVTYIWTLEGAPGAKTSGTVSTNATASFPFEQVAQSRALSLKVQAQVDDAGAGAVGVPTVFFLSDGLDGISFGNYEICAMNADGSNRRRITKTSASETWLDARNAGVGTTLLTFTRNINGWSKIFTINPDGTDEKMISPVGDFNEKYPRFRNSNAGNQIIFSSTESGPDYSIYRMDPNGGARTQCTVNPAHAGIDHIYPDYYAANRIVFIAKDTNTPDNTQLYTRNDDGAGGNTLLAQTNDGREEKYTYVNPTNTHVYYYRCGGSSPYPNYDVYRIDLASGVRDQITSDNTHGSGLAANTTTTTMYCSKPVGGEDIFTFEPAPIAPPAKIDYKSLTSDGAKYHQIFPCFTQIDTGPTTVTIGSTDVFIIPANIKQSTGGGGATPPEEVFYSKGWIYYSGTKNDINNDGYGRPFDRRIWRVKPDGTGKLEVTDPATKGPAGQNDAQPSTTLDGKTIVFSRDFDLHPTQHWRSRVMVMSEIGPSSFSTPVQIGSFPSVAHHYMNPTISPDGTLVAISRHQSNMTANSIIHLFVKAGATYNQVGDVTNSGREGGDDKPSFSPDITTGTYLLTWIDSNNRICARRINANGTFATGTVIVTNTLGGGAAGHSYRSPRFQYRQNKIVAIDNDAANHLCVIDFNPATLAGTTYTAGPPFTIDGNASSISLSYLNNEFTVGDNSTGGYCQTGLKVDITTGVSNKILAPVPDVATERNIDDLFWTPGVSSSTGGSTSSKTKGYIFYSGTVSNNSSLNNRRIWRVNSDGSMPLMLTGAGNTTGNGDAYTDPSDFQPRCTLDGKTIVFARSVSGNQDIWLMRDDGSDIQQLPILVVNTSDNEWNPDISDDGKLIAWNNSTTNQTLVANFVDIPYPGQWVARGAVNDGGSAGGDTKVDFAHFAKGYAVTWRTNQIFARRLNDNGTPNGPVHNFTDNSGPTSGVVPGYPGGSWSSPKFFNNSNKIIATRVTNGTVWVIDFDPTTFEETNFTQVGVVGGGLNEIAISPLDDAFAYAQDVASNGYPPERISTVTFPGGVLTAIYPPYPPASNLSNVDDPAWAAKFNTGGITDDRYNEGWVYYSGTNTDATSLNTTPPYNIANLYTDRRIWRAKPDGSSKQMLTGTGGDVPDIDIHPRSTSDGKTVIFSRAHQVAVNTKRFRVFFMRDSGGTFSAPVQLDGAVPSSTNNYYNPAISDDGRMILVTERETGLIHQYMKNGTIWSRQPGAVANNVHASNSKPDINHSSNPSYYLMAYISNTNRIMLRRVNFDGTVSGGAVDINSSQAYAGNNFRSPKFLYNKNQIVAINSTTNEIWLMDYDASTLRTTSFKVIGTYTESNIANEITVSYFNNDIAAPYQSSGGMYPCQKIARIALSGSTWTPGQFVNDIAPVPTDPGQVNVDDPFWAAGYTSSGNDPVNPATDSMLQMTANIALDKPYALSNLPSAYDVSVQAMGGSNKTEGIIYYPDINTDGVMESSVGGGATETYLYWANNHKGSLTMRGNYRNPEDKFAPNTYVEGWFKNIPDGAGRLISYDPGIFLQTKPFNAATGIYDGYFLAEEKATDPQEARNNYLDEQFILVGGSGTLNPPTTGQFNADMFVSPMVAGEDGAIQCNIYGQGGTGYVTYEWEVVRLGTTNINLMMLGSPRSSGGASYTFVPSSARCPDGTPMGDDASSMKNTSPYSDTYIIRCRVRDNNGTGTPIVIRRAVVVTPVPLSAQVFCVPPAGSINSDILIAVRAEGGIPPYDVTLDYGDKTIESFAVEAGDSALIVKSHQYSAIGDYVVSVKVTDRQPKTVQDPFLIPQGSTNYSQRVFIGDEIPMRVTALATPTSGIGVFRTMVNYVVSGGTRDDTGGYEVACVLYDAKGAVVKSNGMDQIVVRNSSSTFGVDSLPNTFDDWHLVMGLIPSLPNYLFLPPNNTDPFLIPEEMQNMMDQYHPLFLTVPGPGNYVLQVIARDARGEISIDELNITSTGYIAPFDYNGLGAPRIKRSPDGRPVHAFRAWFDPTYRYGGSGGPAAGVDLVEDNTRSEDVNSYRLAKADMGVLSQLFAVDPNPSTKGHNIAKDPTLQSLYSTDQSTINNSNKEADSDFYDTYTIGRVNINTASEDVLTSLFMRIRKVRGYYDPDEPEYDSTNPNKHDPHKDEYLTPDEARDLARATVKYRNAFYASNKPKMSDGVAKGTWTDWGENTGSIVDHLPVLGPFDGVNPMNNEVDSTGYDARLPEPGDAINNAFDNHRANYFNLDVKQGGANSPYFYQFYAQADAEVVRLQHSTETDEEYARYLNNVLINSYDNSGASINEPPNDSLDIGYASNNERSRTGFDARYYLTYSTQGGAPQVRKNARNKQGMIYTPSEVAYTWMPNAPFNDPFDLLNVIDHSELSTNSLAFNFATDNSKTSWDDRYDNFELNGAGDVVPVSGTDNRSSTWRIFTGPSLFRYAEVFNRSAQEYQVVCNYLDDISKYLTTRSYVYRISAVGAVPNTVTSDDDKLSPGTLSRNRKLTAIVDIGDMYVGRDVDSVKNPFLGNARILWIQDEVNSGLGF